MIVSNADLPAVEKLHYLKNHVTREAARRISNLAVTADNFSRAWDALIAQYGNKRVLVSSYLDQLFGLQPLIRKSAYDLKDLVATVKEALGGLQSLGASHMGLSPRLFRRTTIRPGFARSVGVATRKHHGARYIFGARKLLGRTNASTRDDRSASIRQTIVETP